MYRGLIGAIQTSDEAAVSFKRPIDVGEAFPNIWTLLVISLRAAKSQLAVAQNGRNGDPLQGTRMNG